MIKFKKEHYGIMTGMTLESIDVRGKEGNLVVSMEQKKYLKKPIPIFAVHVPVEFEVETKEGMMKGKPDDYLIQGIKGELYPCDREIFEESYTEKK